MFSNLRHRTSHKKAEVAVIPVEDLLDVEADENDDEIEMYDFPHLISNYVNLYSSIQRT